MAHHCQSLYKNRNCISTWYTMYTGPEHLGNNPRRRSIDLLKPDSTVRVREEAQILKTLFFFVERSGQRRDWLLVAWSLQLH